MITDFHARSSRAELMDTEDVSSADFAACLRDLSRVNRLTLAYRPTLHFFDRLVRRHAEALRERPLRVLDVGSGYGDTLRAIASWARRRGVRVELTGVDLNPQSAAAAADATPTDLAIRWVTADAFHYESDVPIDVVLSSLFTHHLPDPSIVRFLSWMEERARLGWFVNDLYRHPVPYHLFRVASRLLRFHRFVQHDGPVSIARAFASQDWAQLIARAGLQASTVEVRRVFPYRLTVGRIKA